MSVRNLPMSPYGLAFSGLLLLTMPTRAQFLLDGDAVALGGDCFRLTEEAIWENGSVWHPTLIDLREDFAVSARLSFGTLDGDGADGIAFLLQPISTALGSAGGGIGYQGVSPSVAVEFDTYRNFPNLDPEADHVAIQRNGDLDHGGPNNLDGPVNIVDGVANVEDGAAYPVLIRWNAETLELAAFVDCALRVRYVGDLVSEVFGGDPLVYIGFTSSTGGMVNEHRVCVDRLDVAQPPEALSVCRGDSVALAAPDGFSGYAWSPAAGLDDPSAGTAWASPPANTTYTVRYEDACGNAWTDTFRVTVLEGPVVDLGPDTVICAGETVILSDPDAPGSLLWSDGSTGGSLAAGPGLHWLQATDGGCPGRDTVLVRTLDEAVDLGGDRALCPGDSAWLTVPALSGAVLAWSDGSVGGGVWASAPATVSVTVSRGGCTARDSVALALAPLPDVALPDSVGGCRNTVFAVPANGNATAWTWSTGATGPQTLVLFTPGLELIWVEGALDGCTARDTARLYEPVDCACRPLAPNAFTPNGDGLNERFGLLNTEACPRPETFSLSVRTRWGEPVFETTAWGTFWDGTFRGRPAEAGAYVWSAAWRFPGEEAMRRGGSVTLLR
jgi:gliding motility-associated-like protein